MNLDKILSDLHKYTSFKECLDWDEDLADHLLKSWKRDQKLLRIVPKSLHSTYMTTYLPPKYDHLVYPLVNWLKENEDNEQD